MALNISPSTSIERKLLFMETLLNSTDKVSKVSEESINSGIAGGVAKVAGKAEKDIVLAISGLFPDSAFDDQLDQVCKDFGISPRFTAIGSSTYVRISAVPGTQYLVNTNTFKSSSGIRFTLDQDTTIPAFGYTYAKVKSIETGSVSNVDPLTISQVSPQPNGHINVVNEYKADGGRDIESDEILRIRIKDGANILARGTTAMLEQVFLKTNTNILRVENQGTNLAGKVVLAIVTQNGADLTQDELDELLENSAEFFCLTEYKPFGTNFYGVELKNIEYQNIDVSVRADITGDPDEIRKQIQVNMSKYVDPRFFDSSKHKVEWDNLLQICKNVPGMNYVPDQYFYPRADVSINVNKLPRMRGFLLLDLNGQIIQNFQGTLLPVYYPGQPDFSFSSTVLDSI